MNMKVIQDMNSMRTRAALALALSAGLISTGAVVGWASSPPALQHQPGLLQGRRPTRMGR